MALDIIEGIFEGKDKIHVQTLCEILQCVDDETNN